MRPRNSLCPLGLFDGCGPHTGLHPGHHLVEVRSQVGQEVVLKLPPQGPQVRLMVAVRDVEQLVEELLPQIHLPLSATGREMVFESLSH